VIPRAAGLLLAGLALGAGGTRDRDLPDLAAYVHSFIDRADIPAAAVAVVEGDRVLFLGAFGRDTRSGAPVTPDSRFYIGSCTKTLTALAVVQLADRGQLDLDAPFRRYVADFSLGDPALAAKVEVRHLLSHTSGIGTRAAFDRDAQWKGRFDHLDFRHPPGRIADYSSLNFLLLGRLIERVSGMPYAEYTRRHVFGPLGMAATTASREEAEKAGLVQGHTYFFGWTVPRAEPPHSRLMVPAGYVVSTARDLAAYLSFLLDRGRQERTGVLSPAAVDRMLTPWHGGATGPALGWGVGTWQGEKRVAHAGMTPGFAARLALLPDRNVGAAVLIARNAGPFLPADADLMEGVLQHVTGRPDAAPRPREWWVHLAMLALLAWALVSLAVEGWRLRTPGSPLRVRPAWVWLVAGVKIALHLGGAILILHKVAEISLAGLLEFFPDLGLLLVAGTTAGVVEAALRAVRFSIRPHHRGSAPTPSASSSVQPG
jgi:CubicO group peptidase (beta-lactamase class C family)